MRRALGRGGQVLGRAALAEAVRDRDLALVERGEQVAEGVADRELERLLRVRQHPAGFTEVADVEHGVRALEAHQHAGADLAVADVGGLHVDLDVVFRQADLQQSDHCSRGRVTVLSHGSLLGSALGAGRGFRA